MRKRIKGLLQELKGSGEVSLLCGIGSSAVGSGRSYLMPDALRALTGKLKTDGACEIVLARGEVLDGNDQANVFLLIRYSVGAV